MTAHRRVYLAGPEVFFPAKEHAAIVASKKRLLEEAGLKGVDPLDTELVFPHQEPKPAQGHRIYLANRELMDGCIAPSPTLSLQGLDMQRSAPVPPSSMPMSSGMLPAAKAPEPLLDDPGLDERERVIAALEQAGWVQAKAARLLNMTPRQIAYRIQPMNIDVKKL